MEWVATLVAIVGLFVSLHTTRRTIAESNKARDLQTLESIRSSVQQTSIGLVTVLRKSDVTDDECDFFATHFLDTLEFAAHIHSQKMVGDKAREFVSGWLKAELEGIASNQWLREHLRPLKLNDGRYGELRAFARAKKIVLFKEISPDDKAQSSADD